MQAGLDTNLLIDLWLLERGPVLTRVLEGEGWTTVFVDGEFFDPATNDELSVAREFPFLEVDPVDARLLTPMKRDQIAIVGPSRAEAGAAAGETSLAHVALNNRSRSIILSNDSHAVGLGRRYGLAVRGTLYVLHRAYLLGLLKAAECWEDYEKLRELERRPPDLSRAQFESYLATGIGSR